MIRTGLIRGGVAFMIRDTFETNPGLCQLFKRKIIERARFVGLNKDLIDFDGKIDMKGSYHDNLRIFYREYPRLSKGSDYFRPKPLRRLGGAALEESWHSYVQNNGHERLTEVPSEQLLTWQGFTPELTVTYNIGGVPTTQREDAPRNPDSISLNPMSPEDHLHHPAASTHRELVKLILDHVTEMAGEKVTKAILHQIRQEIHMPTFHHSKTQTSPHNLIEALDETLTILHHNRR
jgi:hypothetical protein